MSGMYRIFLQNPWSCPAYDASVHEGQVEPRSARSRDARNNNASLACNEVLRLVILEISSLI